MFLHLGDDFMVPEKEIIGIFSLEEENIADNNTFLGEMKEEGFVTSIGSDQPKSFVVCHCGNKPRIFLSPISSRTLVRRSIRSLLSSGRK